MSQHLFKLFERDPTEIHLRVLPLHFQEGLIDNLLELLLVEVLGDLAPKVMVAKQNTHQIASTNNDHQHDNDLDND